MWNVYESTIQVRQRIPAGRTNELTVSIYMVIVPPQGQKLVLEELHEAHLRAGRMKALAHSFIWWPGMDAEIGQCVRIIFANHRIPCKVVTNNGSSFTSVEFRKFMCLKIALSIHQAAGCAVQMVQEWSETRSEEVVKFLIAYWITSQTTTGIAPAQLLVGRHLRSRLDCLFPNHTQRVEDK